MPFHLVLLISTGAAALLQPPPALHGGGSRPVALEVKRPERHVPERHVPASAGMPIAIPLRPIPLRLHAPRAGTVMQLFPPPRPPRVDELLPRGAPFRDVERDIFRYLGGLAAVGGFAAALFFFLSLGALPVILLSVGGVGAILYASSAGEGAFFARRDAEFGYSDEFGVRLAAAGTHNAIELTLSPTHATDSSRSLPRSLHPPPLARPSLRAASAAAAAAAAAASLLAAFASRARQAA